jgi:hypothetical protein
LIPEAKTQSKESKYFSWLAQKVEEGGIEEGSGGRHGGRREL